MTRRTRIRQWLSRLIEPNLAPAHVRSVQWCEAGGHSVVVIGEDPQHVDCHCPDMRGEVCEERERGTVTGERVASNGRGRHG